MSTKRCTTAERQAFGPTGPVHFFHALMTCEPALGSLTERLDIIIRRQGGTVGVLRMGKRERAEYEAWLQEEQLAS